MGKQARSVGEDGKDAERHQQTIVCLRAVAQAIALIEGRSGV